MYLFYKINVLSYQLYDAENKSLMYAVVKSVLSLKLREVHVCNG